MLGLGFIGEINGKDFWSNESDIYKSINSSLICKWVFIILLQQNNP